MLIANSMKSQIFVAIGVAIVASVLVTGLASTIYAQSNMTGGNMTGGNMTGGNMTGGNTSMPALEPQVTVEATTVMETMEAVMATAMEETAAVMEKTDRTS